MKKIIITSENIDKAGEFFNKNKRKFKKFDFIYPKTKEDDDGNEKLVKYGLKSKNLFICDYKILNELKDYLEDYVLINIKSNGNVLFGK